MLRSVSYNRLKSTILHEERSAVGDRWGAGWVELRFSGRHNRDISITGAGMLQAIVFGCEIIEMFPKHRVYVVDFRIAMLHLLIIISKTHVL
ncbi:hypothetical protein L2E82_44788 [Cichorium intybus]|uniref:Uncharacterized protein n=1 Tax=Cichorium intybus TaxID=13427 RepID=A0ACB8ZRI6_CICIN|nr:hypothetical protein L2E82_44788 [Cichorium intybus]